MSKFYAVSLPVKPYIKRYVETVEGNPIQFRGTSMLCIIVRAFMENKNYTGLSRSQKEAALSLRTANVTILVPIKKMHSIGTDLNQDGVLLINRFLEDCFERALQSYMKDVVAKAGRYKGYKEALEAFSAHFNIELEEDITYDGLKKMEYRNRNKAGNFFSTLVPSC